MHGRCSKCGKPMAVVRGSLPAGKRTCQSCRRLRRARTQPSGTRRHTLTRQQRGYGTAHDRARAAWQRKINAGGVACGYCGELIVAGVPWDLSHPFDDKTQTPVPWHRWENRIYASTVTRKRRRKERQWQREPPARNQIPRSGI